jgi:hypothetical protein
LPTQLIFGEFAQWRFTGTTATTIYIELISNGSATQPPRMLEIEMNSPNRGLDY